VKEGKKKRETKPKEKETETRRDKTVSKKEEQSLIGIEQ
jgi:hypothetical protein